MKNHCLLFGCILVCQVSFAQSSKWINYANDCFVTDILPTNDFVWVTTQGGFERIDRNTGQRKIYQPWNSGLSGIDLLSVSLAPDGKMWVSGSKGGLHRFDGEENWEQFYDINTGNPLVQILELEITPDGKLWFISNINGSCTGCSKVLHYDGTHFTEYQDALNSIFGSAHTRNLTLDTTGTLWVSNAYKIARHDGSNFTDMGISLLPNEAISNIGFDRHNTLWVSTWQYISGSSDYVCRLRYFDGNTWSELDASTMGGEIFRANKMFSDATGNFYLSFSSINGSETSFAKFDGNTWEYFKVADLPNRPTAPNAQLQAVDGQGHWWFLDKNGVHNPRVFEYDGEAWKSYNTEIYPLASNHVTDVAFDCENNTWFGGQDMLTKFDGISWKDYTMYDMGFNTDYFSIWSFTYDTANCNLWFTFNQNTPDPVGFAKFDGSTFTTYSTPSGAATNDIAIAKDGTVWVASSMAGLGKFDGNNWTWYNEQNSPISNYVNSVTIDHAQNVWITTSFDDGVARWDGNSWLLFDENNSPISGSSYWLFVDHDGMIWTSNATSLLRYDGIQWQTLQVPGTAHYGISAMTQDHDHNFWLSNASGVHKWNGSVFESYNFIDDPLATGSAWHIRIDPFNNKWFAHFNASGATVFNERGITNHLINPTAGVRGMVFFDADQDGLQGQVSAEPGIPNEKVYLQPDSTTIFTNVDGKYTLFPPPGNYELNYTGNEDFTPTTSPVLPLNMGNHELSGFDFGAWAVNPKDSISLNMTVGNMRCNGEGKVWLSITNYGLLEAAGEVRLQFDTALTFFGAEPAPDTIQGNLVIWHYSGLAMYELLQIGVVFAVPGVDSVGQILSFQAEATVLEAGVVMASAEDDERAMIRCSFDPNDKAVAAQGPSHGIYSLLTDAIDFTVRFQNSGNDTAFTVIIRDTLNANLDLSSLQIIASSHTIRTTMSSEGVLTFVFDNINLLWETVDYAGSQGFVKYRIVPKTNLPDPTFIYNTAHIYFDFNPAIVTNTTTTILVETLPSVATEAPAKEMERTARVYPNPNSGNFWVEWLDEPHAQTWQISIVDMLGRSCFQSSYEQKTIEIQGLSSGFYFVFLEKEGKVDCFKLVVQR